MKKIAEKLKERENMIAFMFFLITMITAISPLISRYCINGHDLEYHLLRIESLKEGILSGHPFAKVNALFFGGSGYASSMFYSDLLLHIPALLRVMHVGIGKSFHIYTALVFILTYLSAFYCVWKMTLSKSAATFAAVLLTLCPYHMDDMLVRTACGENTAFIFLPFAIYGVYNVVCEQMDKPWVLGFGFAGLVLSHPATFILTVIFALFAFLINIKTIIKESGIVARLCLVTFLSAMVTSFFWLPMLEQFADASFYVSNNWTDLLDSAVGFSEIASQTFPCVGILLFACAIPRVFLSRREDPILKYSDLLMVFAAVFAIGATNVMPWERVARFFGFLQFPWRMFIMTSVLLAMADAIVIRIFLDRIDVSAKRIATEAVLIILTALSAGMAIDHHADNAMGYYDYSDDYYSFKPFTVNVIAGEWLPQTVKDPQKLVDESDHMIFDDGTEASFTRQKGAITADIPAGHEYVDVPFIYYKGYSAVIEDGLEKTKLEVTDEGENGMCRVFLSEKKGELTVKYSGTILQYVSYGLTLLFLLLVLDLVYLKNKYKKKLKMRASAAGANLGKIACLIFVSALAMHLSACGTVQIQTTTGYEDPEDMIKYLKDVNSDETDDEDIYNDRITVNVSHKGYDSSDNGYAVVIDETSGEQEISVVSLEEASAIVNMDIPSTDGLYDDLLEKEIEAIGEKYRTDSLKGRIMHETDALLVLEIFPEKSCAGQIEELAKELGDDLIGIPGSKIEDTQDRYNYAAVLAKAAYVLPDWERADEAAQVSESFFKDAESDDTSDAEPAGSRMWAAAELYRLTGVKTYRAVADSIAMDMVPEGFSYEDPGFFGVFAYLMSTNPTNYNVSTTMMNVVFDEANRLIKEPVENEFLDKRVDEQTAVNEEKTVKRMLDEIYLVTMTNYVSVSVEYGSFVKNRLDYIFGANLSGIDHTDDDRILSDAPRLFVLSGICGK